MKLGAARFAGPAGESLAKQVDFLRGGVFHLLARAAESQRIRDLVRHRLLIAIVAARGMNAGSLERRFDSRNQSGLAEIDIAVVKMVHDEAIQREKKPVPGT